MKSHQHQRYNFLTSCVPALCLLAMSALATPPPEQPISAASSERADSLYGETIEQSIQHWTSSEHWAWARIRTGLPVDFNEKVGQSLDPTSTDIDPSQLTHRSLGATFLATVLGDRRFYKQIPVSYVEISGAYFPDGMELHNISIPVGLGVQRSLFESKIEMTNFSSTGPMSFTRSVFGGDLVMTSSHVKELNLKHVSAQRVKLWLVTISEVFTVSSSTIAQSLEVLGSKVARFVSFAGSTVGSIRAPGIQVDDQMNFLDSTVHGHLDLEGSVLDELVIFKTTVNQVLLTDAKIDKTLSLRDTKIKGTISVNRARIGAELFVWTSDIANCMDFTFTEVIGSVKLTDSSFGQLTGSASKVTGSFQVERVKVNETLDLNNLLVAGIFGIAESELPELDVSGGKFGAQFVVQDSTIDGEAKLNSVDVKASLLLRRSQFSRIDLMAAKIAGRFATTDSEIDGNLLSQSAIVDGDLVLADSAVVGEIDIQVAEVSGYVLIDGLSKATALGMQGITSGEGLSLKIRSCSTLTCPVRQHPPTSYSRVLRLDF